METKNENNKNKKKIMSIINNKFFAFQMYMSIMKQGKS